MTKTLLSKYAKRIFSALHNHLDFNMWHTLDLILIGCFYLVKQIRRALSCHLFA